MVAQAPNRPFRLWGIAALFVIALVVLHVASSVLLLAFAGILFGTSLRGLATVLHERTGVRMTVSLVICIIALALVSIGTTLWILPGIIEQFGELAATLSNAATTLRASLQDSQLGRRVLDATGGWTPSPGSVMRAAGLLGTAVGALASAVFVLFVALYLAASPAVYRDGFLRVIKPAHRGRAREILDELASTLRRWLLGRMISMTAVGVTTALGLWLLGIPLPIAMGVLAGALGFIPNIGPIVSAVPALLLAATISPAYIGYVGILYLVINLADGYILTPLVDRRSVSSPPALVITAQLLFGALWGILGVALATPLVACATVIVHRTYVRRIEEAPAS